jgi:hypothetical protein
MSASVDRVTVTPTNSHPVTQALYTWLIKRLDKSAIAWLDQTLQQLLDVASERFLFTRFSLVSRRVGKADLKLTEIEAITAQTLRDGWMPQYWSIDQATRTLLLLVFPSEEATRYERAVETLFSAADFAEQVALYQSLPLLPHPEKFRARAQEGLRSNIQAVFNAVALNSPYPADYFDEADWNQMILKALFIDSDITQIQRLDERANATLAQMLSDYAHERWAAGRSLDPQLWRLVGPFARGPLVADLAHMLSSHKRVDQQAAALACASAPSADAQMLLDQVPSLKQQIAAGQLTWDSLSQTCP